jgi:hypothetical protein
VLTTPPLHPTENKSKKERGRKKNRAEKRRRLLRSTKEIRIKKRRDYLPKEGASHTPPPIILPSTHFFALHFPSLTSFITVVLTLGYCKKQRSNNLTK